MPPRPQRLVRQRPWTQRVSAMLNPFDLYLSLSEEIQTFNWDSKAFGTRFGLIANFVFLVARANAASRADAIDDLFGDSPSNGWVTVLVNFLVWALLPISVLNAWSTMTRTRHYRLFEANVEAAGPATPSAHRVRVDSSPASSTPLRMIQEIFKAESAQARAHPDKTRDVWEMRVWDPYPATLRMFCLFSPGHVLIYWLFLPLTPLDPRPSVTVFKCLVLQILLSVQLLYLQARFSQQGKDMAIIQKEVMHEYDTKFVHPRLHPVYREVGIQVSINDNNVEEETVETGTPSTLIRRGFQTHPNQNYARHFDPDGEFTQPQLQPQPVPLSFMSPQARTVMSPGIFTPSAKPRTPDQSVGIQTTTRPSTIRQTLPGHGGSLGVYQHMKSPLKKATSFGDINTAFSPRNNREMAAYEQRELAERRARQSSPIKDGGARARQSSPVKDGGAAAARRITTQLDAGAPNFAHSPTMLANARANRWTQERFPSRRLP